MNSLFFKKHWKMLVLIMAMLILAVAGGIVATAADVVPGTDSDPVVTKSYVDALVAGLSDGGTQSGTSGGYKIVHLDANTRIFGGESTQMILRSGKATVWTDKSGNGVSDLTSGKDLKIGESVSTNHLLMIPRNDGRGISVWTEAYVMVNGSYTTSAVTK